MLSTLVLRASLLVLFMRCVPFHALHLPLHLHVCDTQSDPAFLAALESGLVDHQDVKGPAHLMLAKLASSPGA